jgi:hypothetical protein
MDEAASKCASLVALRESGVEDLSEFEQRFEATVAGWKPRR